MKSFSFVILSFLLFSCSIYTPSTITTPLFTEKGQVLIGGTAGADGNLHAAYSLSNHISVMGKSSAYSLGQQRRSAYDVIIKGNGTQNELALGYFNKAKNGTIWEIFGGYGKIEAKTNVGYILNPQEISNFKNVYPKYEIKANNFYIQPSFGKSNKNVEFSFNCRIGNLHFQKPISEVPDSILVVKNLIDLKNNFALLEPAITLRLGTKYVKFQLQYLRSFSIGRNLYSNNSGTNLSLGLFAKFPTKKKDEKIL